MAPEGAVQSLINIFKQCPLSQRWLGLKEERRVRKMFAHHISVASLSLLEASSSELC